MCPIDPNGMVVDVMTYGHTMSARFWRDSPVTTRVRWYRVPVGTPCLPFWHCFKYLRSRFIQEQEDPQPDEAGMVTSTESYYRGMRPLSWAPNGTWVGSLRRWQEGSDARDHNLTWGFAGQSLQCAEQLGSRLLIGMGRRETHDGFNDPVS
jgi:hypothetical protein